LQASRLGPYEVISQHKNDVLLRDIVTGEEKRFFVNRLSLFSGTFDNAFQLAMRDKAQHLLERFFDHCAFASHSLRIRFAFDA
jgi:hypothetical protein